MEMEKKINEEIWSRAKVFIYFFYQFKIYALYPYLLF